MKGLINLVQSVACFKTVNVILIFQRREVIRHLILRNLAKKTCHLESEIESSDSGEEWGNESTVLFSNNGIDNCQFKERVFAETTKL